MRKPIVFGVLVIGLLVLLIPFTVQVALSNPDPDVGLGYLYDFDPAPYTYDISTVDGSKGADGWWVAQQGVTYLATVREIEFDKINWKDSKNDVWHFGVSASGSETRDNGYGTIVTTYYYWLVITIPDDAYCTGVIQYKDGYGVDKEMHEAAQEPAAIWDPSVHNHGQKPDHFKAYYAGADPKPVPCPPPGVPELPFASAIITSAGFIITFAIRRRQKKL